MSYGLLALLLLWALPERGLGTRRSYALAATLAVLYGLSDEFHQAFVPGRNATAFDVVIDALGALLALSLFAAWQRRTPDSAR